MGACGRDYLIQKQLFSYYFKSAVFIMYYNFYAARSTSSVDKLVTELPEITKLSVKLFCYTVRIGITRDEQVIQEINIFN